MSEADGGGAPHREAPSYDLLARLRGRRALVTGASSGIGAHLAVLLARGGASLAIAARRVDRLEGVAQACRSAGAPRVEALAMDVGDAPAVAAGVARAAGALGGLDLVVANAGVADAGRALDTPPEAFDRVIGTNLRGAWLTCVEGARAMLAAGVPPGGADVVLVASILGLRTGQGVAPYAASKAGVVQLARQLAVEWARFDIRVNALAPGYVATELNAAYLAGPEGEAMLKRVPMRRAGTLADLDAPFLLLAAGASRYLTGAVLTVDGGHHVNPL